MNLPTSTQPEEIFVLSVAPVDGTELGVILFAENLVLLVPMDGPHTYARLDCALADGQAALDDHLRTSQSVTGAVRALETYTSRFTRRSQSSLAWPAGGFV